MTDMRWACHFEATSTEVVSLWVLFGIHREAKASTKIIKGDKNEYNIIFYRGGTGNFCHSTNCLSY
jgi:hypothetical protein